MIARGGALLALLALLALAGGATAGELVLANGSRVQGELANESLLVSTGSDLIEVRPETIGVLTPSEVRLKDGRVVQGTLVGGRVKTKTALGELTIPVDELSVFRAEGSTVGASPPPAPAGPSSATSASAPVRFPSPTGPAPASEPQAPHPAPEAQGGTPRDGDRAGGTATGSVETSPTRVATTTIAALPRPAPGLRLEVLPAEIALHRDAVAGAPTVGTVYRGQQVSYVDAIDRRLWVMNRLIFDGGHWIKVRAADGTEGWVPASAVREVR